MNQFLSALAERNSVDKFISAFKSIVWLSYVMGKMKCSTVYRTAQVMSSTDPKTQQLLIFEQENRFLCRKRCGEVLRVHSKIQAYETLVPGSANILEHPLFCFLSNRFPEYWLYCPEAVEAEVNKLPQQQSKWLLRLNTRLLKRLSSPLKLSVIKHLLAGDAIDALAALLFLYAVCHRQYVRPSFFCALEKEMLRLIIQRLCLDFDVKWGYQLIKAIQLKFDDIEDCQSPIKKLTQQSRRKKSFHPTLMRQVTNLDYLKELVGLSDASNSI